jgi:DNA invertase Pin-like site-specific DNA recombinase
LDERGIGVRSLADAMPLDTTGEGMGRVAFLLIALFAGMECAFAAERADHARTVAEAKGRRIGRSRAHPPEAIEHAQLLRAAGHSLGAITTTTGIPKSSFHRYLATPAQAEPST